MASRPPVVTCSPPLLRLLLLSVRLILIELTTFHAPVAAHHAFQRPLAYGPSSRLSLPYHLRLSACLITLLYLSHGSSWPDFP